MVESQPLATTLVKPCGDLREALEALAREESLSTMDMEMFLGFAKAADRIREAASAGDVAQAWHWTQHVFCEDIEHSIYGVIIDSSLNDSFTAHPSLAEAVVAMEHIFRALAQYVSTEEILDVADWYMTMYAEFRLNGMDVQAMNFIAGLHQVLQSKVS